MKKAIITTFILFSMITAFAIGVLKGIQQTDTQLSLSEHTDASYHKKAIPKEIQYRSTTFTNVSGKKTTINGIPINLWMNQTRDSLQTITQNYQNQFNKQGWVSSNVKTENSSFLTAIDPEQKKFFGTWTAQKERNSLIIPFTMDIQYPLPKDTWDKDIPDTLKEKKGFHFRTTDGKIFYENYCYFERQLPGITLDHIKWTFHREGWKLPDMNEKNKTFFQKHQILTLTKDQKQCIITAKPCENRNLRGTLVTMFISNL